MGSLIVQFNRKRGKDAASGEVLCVFEIVVSEVFQQSHNPPDRAFNSIQTQETPLTPNSPCLIQDLEEQVLFAGEMIVESAFRGARSL